MKELESYFREKIFNCSLCRVPENKTEFMNPYCEKNKKFNESEPGNFQEHRQRFFKEYLSQKQQPHVMIIGEAPGLNGCGYSGIPFTAEYNAINDLSITNYHETIDNFMQEESANLIYSVLDEVAQSKNMSIKDISSKVYLTNSVMCVPLKSDTAIKEPSPYMKKECSINLKKQIDFINPNTIITLGSKAFKSVCDVLEVARLNNIYKKDIKSVTKCVKDKIHYAVGNIKLIPEIHPSPSTMKSRDAAQLYPGLKERLINILIEEVNL